MTFLIGFVLGAVVASFCFYYATHPEDRTVLFQRIRDKFPH